MELNPYAKVPVLLDGDDVVYESAIINEYLDEKYPVVPLMPKHPLGRARARIWIDFFNSHIHATAHDIRHDKEPKKAKQRMTLDKEMAGKRFILGDFSLVDATFIPFYVRRERYSVTIDDSLSNLKHWGEDLIARPAVASTL